MLSELARQALRPAGTTGEVRNGVLLLPRRADAKLVTLAAANSLRDEP